mmetsp:Transcript_46952/g.75461  ORF Transcript_46952/g.75461 Transcript_46952/m.75461 type:complete len:340 (-) Transcript_46952:223-1242(-)
MTSMLPFLHTDFPKWFEANQQFFVPPICNKLLHGGQLKIMFCGGKKANERGDYHIEDGEEFFYMLKGSMILKVLENGKHRNIEIKEGESFLLPAHVPHSPQRLPDSLGLVIERERLSGEVDAMQWFVPGSTDVLWRRTFVCTDLGKDLVPIVKAFKASEEAKTSKARGKEATGKDGLLAIMPLKSPIDSKIKLVAPRVLEDLAAEKQKEQKNAFFDLYKGADFLVRGGIGKDSSTGEICHASEAYYYLLKGTATLEATKSNANVKMTEQSMVLVEPKVSHKLELTSPDSFVLMVSWPSTRKEDDDSGSIQLPPHDSVPELSRYSSYANAELRSSDFEHS